jgi:hypothetical protein
MRRIALWAAVFVLTACSAPALPTTAGIATLAARGNASWMEPKAQAEDLLYVSDEGGRVYVFSYPGGELAGVLKGFQGPQGLCSDKAGNVFIVDSPREAVLEYKHGGSKLIRVFGGFGYPEGCAVDPATGDLAVTTYQSVNPPGPGSVSVYANTKKRGVTRYTDPSFNAFLFCGFDDKGDLYVDGVTSGTTQAQFAELRHGGTSLHDFKLDTGIVYPGGIQWDGSDVAVEDLATDVLYQVKVAGSSGKVVGSTHFKDDHTTLLTQFWIQESTIVLPYGKLTRSVRRIGLWHYPSGGSPEKALQPRGDVELVGATVSLRR